MKKSSLLFILLLSCTLQGQALQLDTVQIISNSKDTVEAIKGTFFVKENRQKVSSDSIKLAFIRLKSTNPNPGAPIIYLSGGPGGSGSKTLTGNRFELFMKLRKVADVIAFDQRGTGLSERLPECPSRIRFAINRAVEKEEYLEKTSIHIKNCLNYWEDKGVDLTAYNTTENAKDIEALRQILNVDKVSIWGISYGSHLAFEYIRHFGDRVDKMVLASLEGPNETIKLPKNTEDFVYKTADLAKTNFGHSITYPNLRHKIQAVHGRLKKTPATAVFKDRQGQKVSVRFSNFELQLAISSFYLKNPEDVAFLPQLYTEMYAGDFSAIAEKIWILKKYFFSRINPMSFAMDMQSGISVNRAKTVKYQMERTILGSTINFLQFEWMQTLDFPMLPEAFRKMPQNKVKALLLSGTLDGRTYLTSAKQIAKKCTNGQHVIIENAGHDLYMSSPLIGDLVLSFLSGKDIKTTEIHLRPTYFK